MTPYVQVMLTEEEAIIARKALRRYADLATNVTKGIYD